MDMRRIFVGNRNESNSFICCECGIGKNKKKRNRAHVCPNTHTHNKHSECERAAQRDTEKKTNSAASSSTESTKKIFGELAGFFSLSLFMVVIIYCVC